MHLLYCPGYSGRERELEFESEKEEDKDGSFFVVRQHTPGSEENRLKDAYSGMAEAPRPRRFKLSQGKKKKESSAFSVYCSSMYTMHLLSFAKT